MVYYKGVYTPSIVIIMYNNKLIFLQYYLLQYV